MLMPKIQSITHYIMEASIESSNAEVCCSEKVNYLAGGGGGGTKNSAAAEEGCINNISLQDQ